MQTIEERVIAAKKLLSSYIEDKIRKEEQLKAKKEQLNTIDSQLRAKGIDPEKLEEIKDEKEKDLLKKVEDFEKKTAEVGNKLREIQEGLDGLTT